jgi:hypothetical protein
MSAITNTGGRMDALELVRLLETQQGQFHRLHLLADRQRALVLAEDHQPLLDLLGERQRLVDDLVNLTGRLAPYRARWTELYQALDDSMRRHVTQLLEEVNGSLGMILQRDQQDTTLLKARRDSAATQIAVLEDKSRAHTAYSHGAAVAGTALMETEA